MSDINITNNFNAPIGQHIDHVDTVNLQMDGDGQFHFGMVEKVNQNQNQNQNQNINNNQNASDVELFHFIHPSVNEQEEMIIHNEVKRLVKRQGVQMICQHLVHMQNEGKLLLPPNPSAIYKELVRMGLPQSDGYSEKNFKNNYR